MEEKTLEALRGSIAKWERIVAREKEDCGKLDCPLCDLFWEQGCQGCPVAIKTGQDACRGSPYERDWTRAGGGPGIRALSPNLKKAALKEVEFLRSLLPAEEAQAAQPGETIAGTVTFL
jgi:hypothetical protein